MYFNCMHVFFCLYTGDAQAGLEDPGQNSVATAALLAFTYRGN